MITRRLCSLSLIIVFAGVSTFPLLAQADEGAVDYSRVGSVQTEGGKTIQFHYACYGRNALILPADVAAHPELQAQMEAAGNPTCTAEVERKTNASKKTPAQHPKTPAKPKAQTQSIVSFDPVATANESTVGLCKNAVYGEICLMTQVEAFDYCLNQNPEAERDAIREALRKNQVPSTGVYLPLIGQTSTSRSATRYPGVSAENADVRLEIEANYNRGHLPIYARNEGGLRVVDFYSVPIVADENKTAFAGNWSSSGDPNYENSAYVWVEVGAYRSWDGRNLQKGYDVRVVMKVEIKMVQCARTWLYTVSDG